jgi:hypothetical protein
MSGVPRRTLREQIAKHGPGLCSDAQALKLSRVVSSEFCCEDKRRIEL